MPFVVTPTATGVEELVLDGLALNDNVFGLEEVSFPPPRQRQEWIGAADSEAQLLVRNPLHENREITALIVVTGSDRDGVDARVAQIVDKIRPEAIPTDGIPLVYQGSGSAIAVTFDVLSGEITDLPVDEELLLGNTRKVSLLLKAKPYWRGTETLTSVTSGSAPVLTAEIANLVGDVPALGRLIITDAATQSRRHVEWGLEGPATYNSATSLIIDSDSMGGAATVTGAYDPNASGSNAYSTTIYPFPTLACGTGAQSHVGSFRVIARVQSTTADSQVRLLWANTIGGEVSATRYTQIPAASRWHELELGVIHVPAVISGTQVWGGFIQAQTGDTVTSATLTVDYLLLVPVTDGSGVARTGANVPDGTMSGYDSFTATTAGVALNARVSPTGPTWATSGAAGDFTFSDALDGEQLTRNTNDASRRLALFGTGTFGDVDTSVRFYIPSGSISNVHVVHARYVDANNYLETELQSGAFEDHDTMVIIAVVGGATVAYASTDISSLASGWYKLRLLAWQGTGHGLALLSTDSGSLRATVELSDASLKAAGTLATGKVGFADIGNAAVARYYDDFYVGVPLTEPTVINSGRNIEIRHDDTIRQDSTGVYMSRPPSYRGSRFLVPVGTSRVLVKARRNDVETSETPNVTDATQLQVGLTPRGLVVPR